jgi:hypothetical protein
MKTQISSTLVLALLCGSAIAARAEYTLILKNGRRIAVQSYREENGLVKFNGLGGEIGIRKEQIETISKGGGVAPGDLDLIRVEAPGTAAGDAGIAAQEGAASQTSAEEQRSREEKEYQAKFRELDERLKAAQDTYAESIRGTAGAEPMQLTTEEQVRARQDDVTARFKDARNNPSEPAPVKLLSPSPFSSLPPVVTEVQPTGRTVSPYEAPQVFTDREQEFLNLRNQALELERERDRLLQEIKQKNFTHDATAQ